MFWSMISVFARDKREAFARRSCSNKEIERDDDSKKVIPLHDKPELGLVLTMRDL
jgi:hypothetical protein